MSRGSDDRTETRPSEGPKQPATNDAGPPERRHSRVIALTDEQRERFASLGPARFQDPEHQRWAQSHRTHQSLSESGKVAWQAMFTAHGREALSAAGKLGWATTVSRYGEEFAYDRLADRRRTDPTVPERQMITMLAQLGQRDQEAYRREVWVAPRTHVDFAWPTDRLALEVYGGVHFGPFFDPDGSRADHDAARIARIEAQGWAVLVVTIQDLSKENWPATQERVRRFIGLPDQQTTASDRPGPRAESHGPTIGSWNLGATIDQIGRFLTPGDRRTERNDA